MFFLCFLIKLAAEVFVRGVQPGAILLSPCPLLPTWSRAGLHKEKPVDISVPNARPPRQCEGTFAPAAPSLRHIDVQPMGARKKTVWE